MENYFFTRTSGRYRALVLVPRFARQNEQKVFITISYITFIYSTLLTFVCLHLFVLSMEEDLAIDHILGGLNFVVLSFDEGEP